MNTIMAIDQLINDPEWRSNRPKIELIGPEEIWDPNIYQPATIPKGTGPDGPGPDGPAMVKATR